MSEGEPIAITMSEGRIKEHMKKELAKDGVVLHHIFMTTPTHQVDLDSDAQVCAKCGKPAMYLTNFLGDEKLRCKKHNQLWIKKNAELPNDMYFSRKIN